MPFSLILLINNLIIWLLTGASVDNLKEILRNNLEESVRLASAAFDRYEWEYF